MSARLRIARYEALAHLIRDLAGPEFGATPACADTEPELFFPISEKDTTQIAAAKDVCASCPVRAACLEHALRSGDQGIWGGTTEAERRALRSGGDRSASAGEVAA